MLLLILTVTLKVFQFHKGSINTGDNPLIENFSQSFQFHKGSINTFNAKLQTRPLTNFNSIKVRLIHYSFYHHTQTHERFQFHKGSINTILSNSFIRL